MAANCLHKLCLCAAYLDILFNSGKYEKKTKVNEAEAFVFSKRKRKVSNNIIIDQHRARSNHRNTTERDIPCRAVSQRGDRGLLSLAMHLPAVIKRCREFVVIYQHHR